MYNIEMLTYFCVNLNICLDQYNKMCKQNKNIVNQKKELNFGLAWNRLQISISETYKLLNRTWFKLAGLYPVKNFIKDYNFFPRNFKRHDNTTEHTGRYSQLHQRI